MSSSGRRDQSTVTRPPSRAAASPAQNRGPLSQQLNRHSRLPTRGAGHRIARRRARRLGARLPPGRGPLAGPRLAAGPSSGPAVCPSLAVSPPVSPSVLESSLSPSHAGVSSSPSHVTSHGSPPDSVRRSRSRSPGPSRPVVPKRYSDRD